MRFFEYWNGFIWEYDSIWDYLLCLLGRLIGLIIGVLLVIGFFMLFANYGNS